MPHQADLTNRRKHKKVSTAGKKNCLSVRDKYVQKYQSFIYSPNNALVSCLKKNNIKIYIKIYIKRAPTCFGVTVTPSSVYCRTVQQTDTNKDLIYAAIPPPY